MFRNELFLSKSCLIFVNFWYALNSSSSIELVEIFKFESSAYRVNLKFSRLSKIVDISLILIVRIMLQWRERTGEVFTTVAGWPEAIPVPPLPQELLILISTQSTQGRTQHTAAPAHLSDLPQGLCRPWEAGEAQSYSRQRPTVPLWHLRPCLQGTRHLWETQVSDLAFFFSTLESLSTYVCRWGRQKSFVVHWKQAHYSRWCVWEDLEECRLGSCAGVNQWASKNKAVPVACYTNPSSTGECVWVTSRAWAVRKTTRCLQNFSRQVFFNGFVLNANTLFM